MMDARNLEISKAKNLAAAADNVKNIQAQLKKKMLLVEPASDSGLSAGPSASSSTSSLLAAKSKNISFKVPMTIGMGAAVVATTSNSSIAGESSESAEQQQQQYRQQTCGLVVWVVAFIQCAWVYIIVADSAVLIVVECCKEY